MKKVNLLNFKILFLLLYYSSEVSFLPLKSFQTAFQPFDGLLVLLLALVILFILFHLLII